MTVVKSQNSRKNQSGSIDELADAIFRAIDDLGDLVVVVRHRNGRKVIVPRSRIEELPNGKVRILPQPQRGEG